jgi:hypothetical protein
MITFELLKDAGVLVVEPKSALSAEDFREISRTIDPYIREKGKLTGLLIVAPSFPGWDSFGALIVHFEVRLRSPPQHRSRRRRHGRRCLKDRPHDSLALCAS